MRNVVSSPDYAELLTRLLDGAYADAVTPVVRAIGDDLQARGVLRTRIDALLAEGERLTAAGERFTPDNAVYRALVDDVRRQSQGYAAAINTQARQVGEAGSQAADTFMRVTTVGLDVPAIAGQFNTPSPEAINRYIELTTSPEMRAELDRYVGDAVAGVDALQNDGLRLLIAGKNPLAAARAIARAVETFPISRANMLMRTLQLNSFRAATAEIQRANANILSHQIRVATLDARTCLACIALHGTRLEIGEVVQDHPNGRCVGVAVARGYEMPPMVRVVDGREVNASTGELWFNALSVDVKRQIAGAANFNALEARAVRLSDFVGAGRTELFGDHVFEKSLVSILGERAQEFYSR